MEIILPAVSFFLVTFLIGIHAVRRIYGKVRNYFVAGNIVPFWVISLSLTGQAIEIGGTRDNALEVMGKGFWAGGLLPFGIGVSLLLIGFFYAKRLHAMKLLTLPDFFLKKYNRTVEVLVSVITVLSFIILLAANLAGIGIILNFAAGIPIWITVTFSAAVIAIYTMAGGLFAVTWNDILHVGIIIIALGAAITWLFSSIGADYLGRIFTENFNLHDLYDFKGNALSLWAKFLALGLGDIVALDFMERVFAAKTKQKAAQSCLIAGGITILVGLLFVLIGMVLQPYAAEAGPTAYPFLYIVTTIFPKGIAIMLLMGLVSACISTADGAIMACTSVISRNIFQPVLKFSPVHKRFLFLTRMAAIPVTVLGVVVALVKPEPGDLLVLAFDVVFAGCFVPLTLGIYWRRANAKAAYWAIVVPSVLRGILYIVIPPSLSGLDTLIPPLLSLAIFVRISLASTENKKKEKKKEREEEKE